VECDEWNLDFVLTGSQKAFAMPPGLAFCTANAPLFSRAKESHRRGLYFDLIEFDDYWKKNQTPNTAAVSLLYAMDVQLERIAAEGIDNRGARHDAMARRTWSWIDEQRARGRDLKVLAPEGYR